MANLSIDSLDNVMRSGEIDGMLGKAQRGVITPSNPETHLLNELQSPPDRAASGQDGKSFSEILKDSVEKVNLYQHQADTAIGELIAGRTKNIHETLLTIERADTSLKLMMQVRNKILDAYKEIMRMQV
jgi:flagellar hook-basal body complex protein FliE